MIPIYEQGNGEGIGHSFDSLIMRFRQICKTHTETKRAHAFAFIFYDFTNISIREVLKSQGGFIKLDRLSGNKLSVFYLHSDNKILNKKFNKTFRNVFEIEETIELPFVLFLKFDGEINEIEDLRISLLEQDDLKFAFNELYETMREYVSHVEVNVKPKRNKILQIVDKYKKIAFEEFVRLLLKDGYEIIKNY